MDNNVYLGWKNSHFEPNLGQTRFFPKIAFPLVFTLHSPLTSCIISEKSNYSILNFFWKKWSLFGPYFQRLVPISKMLTTNFFFLLNFYTYFFSVHRKGPSRGILVPIQILVPIFSNFVKKWSLFSPYFEKKTGPYLVPIRDFFL